MVQPQSVPPPDATAAARLPTLLVGGWLGSGKTTLVNHLLRGAAGRRVAVLVNDFGEVSIDAALIVGSTAGVLSLAGGCLCCSFGDDLVGTLRGLGEREPRPEFVLIELSGVALPGAVLRTVRLVPQVRALGALVLADASSVRAQARDRFVGDTIREQLAAADALLLNKTDRVAQADAQATRAWLAEHAPRARLLPGPVSALPAELVYDWPGAAAADRADAGLLAPRALRARHARFASRSLALPAGTDLAALARRLADPCLGVLRAKAIVGDGAGAARLLQWTPGQTRITSCAARDVDRLVVIGLRDAIANWPDALLI